MNDKFLMNVFKFIGFTISMVFTIVLMTSQATVWWGKILMLLTAVFLEFCKCVAFHKAIYEKKLAAFIIGFTLLFASVIASLSYMYNQQGQIKDSSIKGSAEYELKMQTIKTNKKLIEQKFEMIEELPENYKTKKNKIRTEIAELQSQNNSINLKDVTVIEVTGYSRFLSFVSEFLSKFTKTPLNSDFIEFTFFGMLAVLFEFCAVWLLSETAKEESNDKNAEKSSKLMKAVIEQPKLSVQAVKIEPVKVDETIVKQQKEINKISQINFDDKEFNKKEFSAYLKQMYATSEGEFSKGYKKIKEFVEVNNKDISLSQAKALRIKAFLESIGVLRTEGIKTKILRRI